MLLIASFSQPLLYSNFKLCLPDFSGLKVNFLLPPPPIFVGAFDMNSSFTSRNTSLSKIAFHLKPVVEFSSSSIVNVEFFPTNRCALLHCSSPCIGCRADSFLT